ncbi:MAG: DNA phosphorothioation system restriction enzyme, partial [Candidatus Thorarchaeota archaeon]
MSLRDLNIELSYRSGRNDIVKEFYVPCLSVASSYDRAVGFFTSGGLAAAAKGVASLIRRGGKMRLVASPILSEDDLKDIEEGYEQRVQERITKQTIDVLDNIPAGLIEKRVSCLAWLISVGRLDIKLAFPTRSSSKGVYHEKMGVIKDSDGNAIAFTGSPNETLGGLVSNFESIDVFTTWSSESDRRRVMEKERDFEQLWNDTTRGLRVIDFPDVARERIIALKPKDPPTVDLSPVEDDHPDATRRRMNLREYQQEAIQAWYD